MCKQVDEFKNVILDETKKISSLAIVMHDTPDPDCIASALGVEKLVTAWNPEIKCTLLYSGEISHPQVAIHVLSPSMLLLDRFEFPLHLGIKIVDGRFPAFLIDQLIADQLIQDPLLKSSDEVGIIFSHAVLAKPRQPTFDFRIQLLGVDGLAVDPGNNLPGRRPLCCHLCAVRRKVDCVARGHHEAQKQPEITDSHS